MKIKLYIVTYNREKWLNNTLDSLFNSNLNYNLEVNIINNHSNFNIKEEYKSKVNVLHNSLRPDFSTGHLARNWNQAIINGFKDLNNPDCDILITCQDDTIFNSNWLDLLVNYHNQYSFITQGMGDNFCSYTVDAIKNIGLWDERFCNIGFQEADYFFRALIHNRDKSSINDHIHVRQYNLIESFVSKPAMQAIDLQDHMKSMVFHKITEKLFIKKWNIGPSNWGSNHFNYPNKKSLIENYIYYPYFEKDILNLNDKNYIII